MKNNQPGLFSLFPIGEAGIRKVENLLRSISVHQKIGQIIFSGLTGTYMPEDSQVLNKIRKLVERGIGGLVFFKGDLRQYHHLVSELQTKSLIPLLFSADFERGLAMRISGMVSFPHNMAVANTGELLLAEKLGSVISEEMRALGIHMNFAPVVDLAGVAENPVINIRAYSDNKDTVVNFADSFMTGSKKHNIITVLKHFPGHGYTKEDSHNELPTVTKSEQELLDSDLYPFKKCIESGAQCIMSGHLEVPAFEPEKGLPATLSKNILTNLLRNRLGFDGLIVSDAMNMNGVTNYFSAREAAVKAFLAGNDALLLPADDDIYFDALEDAVERGEISESRLDESVRRILAAKIWAGLFEQEYTALDIGRISAVDASKLADEIAQKSLHISGNKIEFPVALPSDTVCITISDKLPGEIESYFGETLTQIVPLVKKYYISPFTSAEMLGGIENSISPDSLLLIPIYYRARSYQGAIALSDELINFLSAVKRRAKNCIFLFFGNPYLAAQLQGENTTIIAYSDVPASQKAALQRITGLRF